MDIVPTISLWTHEQGHRHGLFPWYFLIQPRPYPETLLSNSADFRAVFVRRAGRRCFHQKVCRTRRSFKHQSINKAEDWRSTVDLERDAT